MSNRLCREVVACLIVGLTFGLCFFGGAFASLPNSFVSGIFREILGALRDSQTQWLIFSCLCVYLAAFGLLQARCAVRYSLRFLHLGLWLAVTLIVGAIVYAFNYSTGAESVRALTFFAGVILGQMIFLYSIWLKQSTNILIGLVLNMLMILLLAASLWNVDTGHNFEYRSQVRSLGPWENPNFFGLLMGTGMVLAAGAAIGRWRTAAGWTIMSGWGWKPKVWRILYTVLCVVVAILTARGLMHSYSRGAWLAVLCGLAYLSLQLFVLGRWIRVNAPLLATVLLSAGILTFWHFRSTDWYVAHRLFSAGNLNDFSWRNRITAWEGALQMTAEHGWFGTGWNRPEPLYEHFYLPPKLSESAAIEMNDYLMLGATLGAPALFCFGMYVWLNLEGRTWRMRTEAAPPLGMGPGTFDWMKTACRSATIVLLVGFWFDGGLFKLATASTFWALLELYGSA